MHISPSIGFPWEQAEECLRRSRVSRVGNVKTSDDVSNRRSPLSHSDLGIRAVQLGIETSQN